MHHHILQAPQCGLGGHEDPSLPWSWVEFLGYAPQKGLINPAKTGTLANF